MIIGLLLASVGIFVLAWIAWSLVRPLLPNIRGGPGSRKLRRAAEALARIDTFVDDEEYLLAAQQTAAAIIFDERFPNRDIISRVGAHHVAVLNKFLLISDLTGRRLETASTLDELFQIRLELLKAYHTERNRKPPRRAPGWAKQAFAQKVHGIQEQLQVNERSICRQLEGVIAAVESQDEQDPPPIIH